MFWICNVHCRLSLQRCSSFEIVFDLQRVGFEGSLHLLVEHPISFTDRIDVRRFVVRSSASECRAPFVPEEPDSK